ncbi:LTA synthase family protein [uncultured Acetobacteroides sp.]|uniref:LTA synthase family protein n=1 Tax=uncultured Acetobacteroides sp. TaxID=1760811 RepID=UPI0029F4C28B|nr:LTA synthase family protein [uncultured Acetobacteroides sp.]
MEKTRVENLDKLIIASYRYLNNVLALLVIFWLMRLFDVFVIAKEFSFPAGMRGSHLLGILYDTYFVFKVAGVFLLPYLLLTLLRIRIAQGLFVFSGIVVVVVNLILVVYFASTKIMLGSDIFGYSIAEMRETLQTSNSFSVINIIPLVAFPILYLALHHYIVRIKIPNAAYYIFYPAIAVVLLSSGYSVANANSFKDSFGASLATNKFGYFALKASSYIAEMEQIENAKKGTFVNDTGRGLLVSSKDYVSKEFPMLRNDNTPDVLSPFFDTTKVKPNIVFILVESLGRAYSGEGADLGSYTPFLDSLSRNGLYFENFLSTGGRSFAVFPSILGSLPLVNRGFMELGDDMPNHNTLLTMLHANGYRSDFVYGGDSKFDNMRQFFERQNTSRIVDGKNFGSSFEKMPPGKSGFSWGYGDMDILSKLVDLQQSSTTTPTVSIAMTLSMHSPFVVKNQRAYYKQFEGILNRSSISSDRKDLVAKYGKELSTVLYFDESLRLFFKKFEKQPSYRNTIFIITGDHRMPEIPIGTQIDRFRVPFLIYSPMLTRSARFRSVSTQFDVAPSLIAFLRNRANLQFPKLACWVGTGLDTSRSFRNVHSVAFMENKNEQTCYLDGINFIAMGKLYSITPQLGLVKANNPMLLGEMTKKLNSVKNVSAFVCSKNKLVPDSLLVKSRAARKMALNIK